MRRTHKLISCEEKARMLDEIADLLISCENGVMTAPPEVIKKYKTPAAWAGYKIMRFLYENRVIEPGGAQETLDI